MGVTPDTAHELFMSLVRVQKLLVAARNSAPSLAAGADPAAYPVLFTIDALDSPRLSEVADAVHSDLSTVSRQVSAMVSHGLLAKEADPADGRAQVLRVTDAGREAIATIKAARGEWLERLLADWDPSDARDFTRHLRHLGDNLDAQLRARGQSPTLPPYFSKEK